MRTEIRPVTIEKDVYIAEDGTEFDDKDECEEYEFHLVGQKLKMYDYHNNPCKFVADCWMVKLRTQEEIESFIALCKYDGISHIGVVTPGVYMYTEGCYGRGKEAWTNLTEIIKSIEESEDNISGN